MNATLLARIKELSDINERDTLEIAEELLDAHLELHPQDTEAWLQLFMVVCQDWYEKTDKAIDCCKKILAYDPHNAYAVLGLFYICFYQCYPYEEMLETLFNFKNDNYEDMSLIEWVRAWYYEFKKNTALQEKALLRSIAYCDKFVNNYESLGDLYMMQGRFAEAQKCFQKGLSNIKNLKNIDKSHIEFLLDEFFRGTFKADFSKDRMQKALDYCNEMLERSN